MKYSLIETVGPLSTSYNVMTTLNEVDFTQFPAIVGNPNYDAFLIQVDLTDEEVHALPTDEWFEV